MNKTNWQLRKELNSEQEKQLSEEVNLPLITTQLLVSRGFDTQESITDFLDTSITKIDNPFKLNDMQIAVERIEQALDNDEKIIIYGDYDSDGLTSTSILKEAIEIIGGNVDTYIPDRFQDGYGPNIDVYKRLIEQGYQLIITVDNGVSGFEAVQYAKEQGVDVVITDHHTLPEELPPAVGIVHPRIIGHEYTCQNLSGAGVAFKVASALLQETPIDLMDLAAIGSISDVVELQGENRAIVANGLKQIQTGSRLGLNALFSVAKLDIKNVDEEIIGFQIAPRLNALGRIENANIGVDLLTASDSEIAKQIASKIDETNKLRRQYSDEVYLNAQAQLEDKNEGFQILYGEDWYEGVLGIAAGKIADETNKPTIVLTRDGDVYKGSGRAPANFNLYDALDKYREFFTSFGGHAQACGVSIKADQIENFVREIQKELSIQNFDSDEPKKRLYDLEVSVKDLSFSMMNDIKILAPFGEGNPKPIFKSSEIEIVNEKNIGSDKSHLKGKLKQNNSTVDFIAFSFSKNFDLIKDIPLYNAYYQVGDNEWMGKKSLQLMICDIQGDRLSTKYVDWRDSQIDISEVDASIAIIFFNKTYFDLFNQKNSVQKAYMWNNPQVAELTEVLVFDRPHDINNFKQFIKQQNAEKIYLLFYSRLKYTYQLQPNQKELHDTLKYFLTHSEIKEEDYSVIAKYLNIDLNNLKFYINVFFELGFVKIENGVVINQPIDKNKKLESSVFYQKRLKRNEVGNLLVNVSYQELLNWLNQQ
ncbi:single-stranded-DNA-specific exonuclease RecJ [Lactobacillus sp. YT155]|uniref:single-stranded-DNA-specific exonuclease RecJ n=1 Tax=Lactobacillus sp. YT155 TaxID=3060955 RepID=UPI00265F7EEA|nr:single-stranded-DNA-specific exonuclease RecJ [Lactobacillus sp. YT155]MDO1605484.1 single-stranded-DNA-specific exonuclease RecJ [Lactobacillus sp. YT155]